MTEHTPTPWKWTWEDESVMALYGPDDEMDFVLWSAICPACQKTGNRCTAPNDANADHIVHCVNAHSKLVLALGHALLALRTDTSDAGKRARQTAAEVVRNALAIAKP